MQTKPKTIDQKFGIHTPRGHIFFFVLFLKNDAACRYAGVDTKVWRPLEVYQDFLTLGSGAIGELNF